MNAIQTLIPALALGLLGCQTLTSFAPLDARLDPVPGGGARYLVVINRSGQELHNCKFSVYVWNDLNPQIRRITTREGLISLQKLGPNEECRFYAWGKGIQAPIVERVSGVDIVGHCDEGRFRQTWLITDSDQLKPAVERASP